MEKEENIDFANRKVSKYRKNLHKKQWYKDIINMLDSGTEFSDLTLGFDKVMFNSNSNVNMQINYDLYNNIRGQMFVKLLAGKLNL